MTRRRRLSVRPSATSFPPPVGLVIRSGLTFQVAYRIPRDGEPDYSPRLCGCHRVKKGLCTDKSTCSLSLVGNLLTWWWCIVTRERNAVILKTCSQHVTSRGNCQWCDWFISSRGKSSLRTDERRGKANIGEEGVGRRTAQGHTAILSGRAKDGCRGWVDRRCWAS